MGIETGRILSFDVGIEEILEAISDEARLPDGDSPLIPSEMGPQNYIESILKARGLDELLVDALKPEVHELSMLIPERYGAMLLDTIDSLKMEAARSGEKDGEILFEAARSLEEDRGLVELMTTLRNILIRA